MVFDDSGRLEDVFQNEIIKRFSSTDEFFKFARSGDGLVLEHLQVEHIREDYHSVEEQKFQTLHRWKQSQGAAATPQLIRDIVNNYLKRKVSSDATGEKDGERQHELPDPVQYKQTSEGPGVANITNIHGPMHGPVLMGNQQVTLGGNAAQGPPAIDLDVPSLKPSSTEITRKKTEITIGSSTLKFPPFTIREDTKAVFACNVDSSPAPVGRTYASSVLSCNPMFQGLKNVKIALATWCSADVSVEATIFSKNNEGIWDQLDEAFLTEEGHIELQNRSIDNLAAFVPTNRLLDIQFKISCFLFNNADMKFAMGFCLHDKAIENVFLHRLKKDNYFKTMKNVESLTVSLGDEILFRITPGQLMQNTKFDIDEHFVSTFQGHIFYCKPDKDVEKPFYEIIRQRSNVIVSRHKMPIPGKHPTLRDSGPMASSFFGGGTTVDFRGKVKVGNFIGNVENADIDMRSYEDGDGDEPVWQKDKLTHEEVMKKKERALKKENQQMRRQGVPDNRRSPRPGGTKVTFHGEIEAETMISNAKNVRIDQRRYKGKHRPKLPEGPEVEKLTKAEQERGGGVEEDSSSSDRGSPRSSEGLEEKAVEQPCAENNARPTSNDCEKQKGEDGQKSSEPLDDNGGQETINGKEEQSHEEGPKDNMAKPIPDNLKIKEDEGRDSEQATQETTSSLPKTGLRERGVKTKIEKATLKGPNKKKGVKRSYEGYHILFGLTLVFCVVFVLFNTYKE